MARNEGKEDDVEETNDNEEEEEEAGGVDYKRVGSIIDKALNDKIAPIDQTLQELKRKRVEEEAEAEEEEEEETEEEGSEEDAELDDDAVLTGKDVKRLLKKEVKKISKTVTKNVNGVLNANATKNAQDVQTFRQFPMLDQNSQSYDPDFMKLTQAEIRSRVQNGRNSEDPYLLQDSAAAVYARDTKWQKMKLNSDPNEFQRNENNRDGQFQVRNLGGSKGGSGPSQTQIAFAQKIGFDQKKLTAQLKKRAKG